MSRFADRVVRRGIARGAFLAALELSLAAGVVAGQAPASRKVPGSIRGIVFDSLITNAPLRGATVELLELNRRAETDARGVFRFDSLPGGRYTISFSHPDLAAIGFVPPDRTVELGQGIDIIFMLGTPSGAGIYQRLCPGQHEANTGVLLGTFTDAATSATPAGVEIRGSWTELTVGRSVGMARREKIARTVTDSSGRYQLCGVPTDVSVLIRAMFNGREGPPLELKLEGRPLAVRRISWSPGDSSGRGAARATGTITGTGGAPLVDATVLLLGTEHSVRTRADGTFALDQLPAGSFSLEARAIGYARQRVPIELKPGETSTIALSLNQVVVKLPDISVAGRGRAFDASGFDQRRLRGMGGYFITRADIVRRGSIKTEDLFRTIPSIQVMPIGGTDYQILSLRGGAGISTSCAPSVFIDRVLIPLDPEVTGGAIPLVPEEIQGIEIYHNPNEAPMEFRSFGSSCGVILLWTRRGGSR